MTPLVIIAILLAAAYISIATGYFVAINKTKNCKVGVKGAHFENAFRSLFWLFSVGYAMCYKQHLLYQEGEKISDYAASSYSQPAQDKKWTKPYNKQGQKWGGKTTQQVVVEETPSEYTYNDEPSPPQQSQQFIKRAPNFTVGEDFDVR